MTTARRLLLPGLLLLALWLAGPLAALAFQAGARQVTVESPGADLAGTLLLPAEDPGGKAVLILPGSGAIDRNGNGRRIDTDSYRLLAESLDACGVASLRVDKRGVGASRPKDPAAPTRFSDLVDDAEAWLGFLERQPGLKRFYLLGHSEGALIASLVAEQEQVSGLVLLAGAGRPIGQILKDQLKRSGLPPALLEKADTIIAELKAGRHVADVPKELHALFRPRVQDFLIGWLKLDPAKVLAASDEPALVVQGTHDLQVSPGDAERLAKARSGIQLVLVEGMNHILKQAPEARAANLATYENPKLPLAPKLVEALQRFVGCRP